MNNPLNDKAALDATRLLENLAGDYDKPFPSREARARIMARLGNEPGLQGLDEAINRGWIEVDKGGDFFAVTKYGSVAVMVHTIENYGNRRS